MTSYVFNVPVEIWNFTKILILCDRTKVAGLAFDVDCLMIGSVLSVQYHRVTLDRRTDSYTALCIGLYALYESSFCVFVSGKLY